MPILVGALTLAGWQTDHYLLKRIIDSPIPVNPMTSVLFLLCGAAILFSNLRPALTRALAYIIGAIALLKGCDLIFDTAFRVDALLYANEVTLEPAFPNTMAPLTTLNFVFLALALAIKPGRLQKLCLLPPVLISLCTVATYALGDVSFRIIPFFTPMALITAVTFFLASCALVLKADA